MLELVNPKDPAAGIRVAGALDFKQFFIPDAADFPVPETTVRLAMTYDGHLVVATTKGVSVINRDPERHAVAGALRPRRDGVELGGRRRARRHLRRLGSADAASWCGPDPSCPTIPPTARGRRPTTPASSRRR